MARGHQAVIRRSLNLPEWIRVRLCEVAQWKEVAAVTIPGWEIRPAEFRAPDDYAFTGSWQPLREGDLFGKPDGTFFLRNTFRIPAELRGQKVWFDLPTTTEMMFRVRGKLVNALDPNRSLIPLAEKARGGETFPVELEAYMRSAPDDQRVGAHGEGHGCVLTWHDPRLVVLDSPWHEFMTDFHVALDIAACAQVDSDVCSYFYQHLHECLKFLDRDTADRAVFHLSLAAAHDYLRRAVENAKKTLPPATGQLALVGHSHLDVAYHWRVRQGIRKNARTTIVQLALMDEYPEMLYSHTQPYLYETLKTHYPDLFAKVKEKVREGRWELVGGMYVEPDCNTPSGEALIRQCLLGKLFFLKEFGVDVDTCWLPDVFGNSWLMPQILAKAGIKYFVSNKMSTWNDTNAFPHNNFLWKGADGTTIPACVPASHFISWVNPEQLIANWEGFREKNTVGESMNMIGFGDGGGGLTREMLDVARRIPGYPGIPRTRHISGGQYLREAFADTSKLAVWDDELYLEMHRGTTTTKGNLKSLNRRCELTARQAEIFGVLARGAAGFKLPAAELTAAWKKVLVNQFHDILPGSHTHPVGREADTDYRAALAVFTGIRDAAQAALASRLATDTQPGRPFAVFNSLNWETTGLVELPLDKEKNPRVTDHEGLPLATQEIRTDDGRRKLLVQVSSVPSVGARVLYLYDAPARGAKKPAAGATELKTAKGLLENRCLRAEFDASGRLTRLFDKRAGREVLAPGQPGNHLQLFEDKPGMYDAWDIVPYYKDKEWDISAGDRVTVVETGPIRAGIRFEKTFFNSRLTQTVWMYADSPRLDFETAVDWHEHNKLLKVAFPVDILARRATYDLSYGAITRSTHANTSWDRARFEVCGHQWADLSESSYGVSLLNDSKYGWDIQGNVMRLSLLRGPIRPDPDSDQGAHRFTYSLFPHTGSWQAGGTFRAAMELNNPLLAVATPRHPGKFPDCHAFVTVDGDGLFLGALKPAEDGKPGDAIARLVESHGDHAAAALRFDRAPAQVSTCDLLERPEARIALAPDGSILLAMKPFEIASLRITLD